MYSLYKCTTVKCTHENLSCCIGFIFCITSDCESNIELLHAFQAVYCLICCHLFFENFVVDSLVYVPAIVCGGSVFGLCFVLHYFVSFLVLKSPWRGREINWLPDVLWLLMFCGSSSRSYVLVCSVWLWYFLIILTYFLRKCVLHCMPVPPFLPLPTLVRSIS